MGPQGCSSGRPTSSCFSTRAGGSLSQLSVQCLSSFFLSFSCYARRSATQQCSSLARTVQPELFNIYDRTSGADIQNCRYMLGLVNGTKGCRMPGSYQKDPNSSVRHDRLLPTPSVGTPRPVHFWLPHCIPSCRFCFPQVPR